MSIGERISGVAKDPEQGASHGIDHDRLRSWRQEAELLATLSEGGLPSTMTLQQVRLRIVHRFEEALAARRQFGEAPAERIPTDITEELDALILRLHDAAVMALQRPPA